MSGYAGTVSTACKLHHHRTKWWTLPSSYNCWKKYLRVSDLNEGAEGYLVVILNNTNLITCSAVYECPLILLSHYAEDPAIRTCLNIFKFLYTNHSWGGQDVGCIEAYLGTEVNLEICAAGWCINPLCHLVNWHQGGIWWRVLTLKALPTVNVQERTQNITKTVSRQWLKKCLLAIYDQLQVCQHCFDSFFTKWLPAPTIFSHSTLNWLAIVLLT